MAESTGGQKRRKVKIGESIQLDKAANMVRLPDGTVVTARGTYMVQHEGAHKVIGGLSFDGTK